MFDQYPTPFLTDPKPSFDLITDLWYPGFCAHETYENLDDEEKTLGKQILLDFTGFMLYYQDCPPAEWAAEKVERCLLIHFPRSLYREWEYTNCILDVLENFFEFLKDENLLSITDELDAFFDQINEDFYENMDEVDNYSLRKGSRFAAEEEGIDPDDMDAVTNYFQSVGTNMLEGVEPKYTSLINNYLTSWVFPFSDSRYIADIDSIATGDAQFILPVLIGALVCEEKAPETWNVTDVEDIIVTKIIPYPMEQRTREHYIPVVHAFFTYLADEKLQPHARAIADTVLTLQERMISENPDENETKITLFLIQSAIDAGINLNDDNAVKKFINTNAERLMAEYLLCENPDMMDEIAQEISGEIKSEIQSAKKPVEISSIPKAKREWYTNVTGMTDQFCDERLDSDYADLCRYVAGKLARKRDCQVTRGKIQIWASGIIYAIGQINFLFDKSFKPYQSADDICQYFETSKSTTSQKAKLIRDLIGMNDYWDPEYSTTIMQENSPLKNLRMTKDGFIV